MKKFLKLYGIIIHAVISTIDYWESLGYKINLEKKEEAVSNQNITYATLRVVHP